VTLVMLEAIRDFHQRTGRIVGMKPAGGIKTAKDAIGYLVVLYETMGPRWMTPDLFPLRRQQPAQRPAHADQERAEPAATRASTTSPSTDLTPPKMLTRRRFLGVSLAAAAARHRRLHAGRTGQPPRRRRARPSRPRPPPTPGPTATPTASPSRR
jgi:hypothetical protein